MEPPSGIRRQLAAGDRGAARRASPRRPGAPARRGRPRSWCAAHGVLRRRPRAAHGDAGRAGGPTCSAAAGRRTRWSAALLALHDLHPVSSPTRLRYALDTARRRLGCARRRDRADRRRRRRRGRAADPGRLRVVDTVRDVVEAAVAERLRTRGGRVRPGRRGASPGPLLQIGVARRRTAVSVAGEPGSAAGASCVSPTARRRRRRSGASCARHRWPPSTRTSSSPRSVGCCARARRAGCCSAETRGCRYRSSARPVPVRSRVRAVRHAVGRAAGPGRAWRSSWSTRSAEQSSRATRARRGPPRASCRSRRGRTGRRTSALAGLLEPDVEALLVRRGDAGAVAGRRALLVPVDACYRLVGLVRLHWKGSTAARRRGRRSTPSSTELQEGGGRTRSPPGEVAPC